MDFFSAVDNQLTQSDNLEMDKWERLFLLTKRRERNRFWGGGGLRKSGLSFVAAIFAGIEPTTLSYNATVVKKLQRN
jgi:hypothetical protein